MTIGARQPSPVRPIDSVTVRDDTRYMPTTDTPVPDPLDLTLQIGAMLRELNLCLHLDAADPRRVAVIADKHRLLALVEAHNAANGL